MRNDGTFIGIEVDDDVVGDAALAAKLDEVCPVDIFDGDDGSVEIVERQHRRVRPVPPVPGRLARRHRQGPQALRRRRRSLRPGWGSAPSPPRSSRPRALAVLGAITIAFSAILVRARRGLAVDRGDLPLPLRRPGARRCSRWPRTAASARAPARDRRLAAAAGVLFAIDLICWHHAIDDVGAGLATVLGNLQVAFVPLVAWLVLRRAPRPARPGGRCRS